jgi:nitrite reductase/ring-hydroxylating ferredoxin subunit
MKVSLIEYRVGRMIVNGKTICLVYSGLELVAFDESCPHANKSLFGGICDTKMIVCPYHKFRFKMSNGKGHGLSLQLYQIKHEDNKIYICLD